MRKFTVILIILLAAGFIHIYAEQPEKKVNMEFGLLSRYIWRGYCLGGAGIQTSVCGELFENSFHSLEVEAWGYTDFIASTKEIDLSFSYFFMNKKAAIRLYDYWYVPDDGSNYLDFKNNTTSHSLEIQFDYVFNLKKDNSLMFKWATFFYGNDKKITSKNKVKQAYSSYFEIKYEGGFFVPKYRFEASAGFSPWESPMNYNVEKFSCISTELKLIRSFYINDDVELTPSVAFTLNPANRDAYLLFGVTASF